MTVPAGGVLYRRDGGVWSTATTTTHALNAVCTGGGKVVVVGESGSSALGTSAGGTWQTVAGPNSTLNGCGWDGLQSFYAVGGGGAVYRLTP